MRYIKPILKPFSFLPALFMLYVIFQFSAQPGEVSGNLSRRATHKLLEITCESFETGWSAAELNLYTEMLHPYVRKLAHITEYFLLAVCMSFPLYVYRLRGLALTIVAGGFCVACACLDEYHQSFVAGRGPSGRDVMIDSIGILAGVILVRIVCFIGRVTIFRERKSRRKQRKQIGR
ncbi:MAG: VanZ family protein [Lachnospiraceae bacterium]|jgi:VanZ family protein|nr:VanZ family protein [Lachnospiraceae bacterium]